MMRRRTSADDTSNHDDDAKLGKKRQYGKAGPQPIVSNWTVIVVVLFFVSLGWLQNHYRQSRSQDPFGVVHVGSPAAKNKPKSSLSAGVTKKSLLTPEEDAALEYDADNTRYHLVFSTDCTPYQHWQSYLVYFSALKVKQPGHVTRIASGCEADEAKAMEDWFDEEVQFMSQRFHLQLTPKFSSVKNEAGETVGDYKFFNKPFGLKYWLENDPILHFNEITGEHAQHAKNDIVILIDPDMGLIRPILKDFSTDSQNVVIGKAKQGMILATKVGPGKPFAQTYGFGGQPFRLDLEKICGAGTPAAQVSKADGIHHYPAGPPYMGTVSDMYRIATKWTEFVPKVYEQYPHLLAEMFAYSLAAAHLELPHQLIDSLMVSDVRAGGEGWPLIDSIPVDETCAFARQDDHSKYGVPAVVHLCQRYVLGKDWFFGKHKVPSDIYDCDVPLFQEPPDNVGTLYDWKHPPGGKREDVTPVNINRHTFMLCFIYKLVNDASTFFKQNACPPDQINLQKTRNLVEYIEEQKHAGNNAKK